METLTDESLHAGAWQYASSARPRFEHDLAAAVSIPTISSEPGAAATRTATSR